MMGTRHLTCVVKDGEYRVAQYGQWDGYPEGQGKTVVEFLRTCDLDRFKAQVAKTRALNDDEVKARWKAAGADDTGWVSMDVAERMKQGSPQLSRDMGADVLAYVYEAEAPEVHLSVDFAADSLFCEYAYVIDLDTDTLEVYKGFNKAPLAETERFAKLTQEPREAASGETYYPVKLWWSCPIAKLTDGWMSELPRTADED